MGMRETLRAATADVHEALHGIAPFARIAEGRMDRAGYGELLAMLERFHRAMAPACAAGAAALHAPELTDAHLARLSALERDLAFMSHAQLAAVPAAPWGDADFAIGCLYTVQGSTLGGKVIARQLQSLLPDGQGLSFFAGSPEDGRHWRILCERLEQHVPSARIIDGAAFAFARFGELAAENAA